jgi:PmbA protein
MTELTEARPQEDELPRLKNIVEDLLHEAERQGATAAEAGISMDQGLSVTARLGDVETIEHHRDQGLGVTVYFGHRKGSASTTDLSVRAVKETVSAACGIARYATDDEYAGLPEPSLLANDVVDLDLSHPWRLTADRAVELAIECEDAARSYHPEISNSEGATLTTENGVKVLGNSLGFLQGYPSSQHTLSCSVLGQRGDSMQRDYWYTVARDRHALESPRAVGEKAAERTIRRLEARSLTPRQCPVIYSAEVARGLLGHLVGAIRGSSLYRKTSFLLDSLGQTVFPTFVHIQEQPHIKQALGSVPFDAEGVATRVHDVVRDGVIQSYILSSYSARKLGLESTGNAGGVHNLTLDPGELDLADLLRQMDSGLLVTELMGQGVNNVTGDYSRGAAGFWVVGGEIQYPVEEITIAGNLTEMFGGIVAIGNDVDTRGTIRTGSILIEAMTVAGN